jgi:hypothetical protein
LTAARASSADALIVVVTAEAGQLPTWGAVWECFGEPAARDQGTQADAAAEEHVADDHRQLAEVRQVDLAGVVLLAVVGHERDDGVKDRGRRQVGPL